MRLKVVCWKWFQPNYRSIFNADHVHILKSMIERNLDLDHKFVCITDDPTELLCDTIELWKEPMVNLPERRPNCYRRLKMFEKNAAEWMDCDFVLSIDLDVVIVSNITSLVQDMMNHDFSIWGDTAKNTHYNGSFWGLRLGSRSSVWNDFDPMKSPIVVNQNGIIGSDQGWISYHLGDAENKLTKDDGIFSYRIALLQQGLKSPPERAKMIFFHGNHDPQSAETLFESPWIRDFYF